jgi:hypothetical protein
VAGRRLRGREGLCEELCVLWGLFSVEFVWILYKNVTLASCLTFSMIRIMVDCRGNSFEDISIPRKATYDAQALCSVLRDSACCGAFAKTE